jgi:hypothetical protein
MAQVPPNPDAPAAQESALPEAARPAPVAALRG